MNDETLADESLAGERELGTSDGATDGGSIAQVLGQVMGTDFKDDASALKAVADTKKFVGQAGQYEKALKTLAEKRGVDVSSVLSNPDLLLAGSETKAEGVDPSQFVDRETYANDMFYAKHPDLEAHKVLIDSYAKQNGLTHEEAVQSDALKSTLEKVKGYEEIQSSKSVLESNPRLGASSDKLTQAREAIAAGDTETGKARAVEAVMDTFQ